MKVQVVAAIIKRDNKFLLGKRSLSKKSASGYWCPISGRIEEFETQEEAVIREVFEEVGIKVKPRYKVGVFDTQDKSAVVHWWLVDIISGEPLISNGEHSDLGRFSVLEMQDLEKIFSEDIDLYKTIK